MLTYRNGHITAHIVPLKLIKGNMFKPITYITKHHTNDSYQQARKKIP